MPSNYNGSLVFFGTGQTSLDALLCLSENYTIELVITKPLARNSAGREFTNPVHSWALSNGIKVITPPNKAQLTTTLQSYNLSSQLAIVIDYGMIIPGQVIDMFAMGILNSHFSLLPKHRGSNPIRKAILDGDKVTGVSIIRITPGLDDGPILSWAELEVGVMDALTLREKLSLMNCALLPETISLYTQAQLEPIGQDESNATVTRKTTKSDGLLDPSKSSLELAREVRAYQGWPKSYLINNNATYIILEASSSKVIIPPAQLMVHNNSLYYGCKNGSLLITTIQPTGKPAMSGAAFINGYKRVIVGRA